MTLPPDTTTDEKAVPPERWLAGLFALLLALLGATLPGGLSATASAGVRAADSRAEAMACARTVLPAVERAEDDRRLPSLGTGVDPAIRPAASWRLAQAMPVRIAVPAIVAEIPRAAVRRGPRQPTGPPSQV